jgi:large subunit ribosomal protein L5
VHVKNVRHQLLPSHKMNRLKEKYHKEILPALKKELKYDNNLSVPQVDKIVVNVGITEDQHQDQALKNVGEQLANITGQKAKTTKAKKSIAGFKLRAGEPIGLMVTLRGERMYQFLDKLINIVLPRVKDFQGVSNTAFDHAGNYNLGLEEQIIFPEIDYDKIDKVRSLQATIVTTTSNSEHAKALLTHLGMPFAKEEKN